MEHILQAHINFYKTDKTKDINFRKDKLKTLYQTIEKHENQLSLAFRKDLGKSDFETHITEIGYIKQSITLFLKNIEKWTKPKHVASPWYLIGSKSKVLIESLGQILIIGSFNYPFQLIMEPLIGAIASGNTCIVKPSEFVPSINRIMRLILEETFEADYVSFVEGEKEVTQALLQLKFDKIFFTGSETVGRIVYERAAKQLTPVILELGGKSPAVVYKDAKLDVIVERIIWGKLMNAGQTCVAPDYVLVDASIKDVFIEKSIEAIKTLYGEDIQSNLDYGRIVSLKHVNRLKNLLEKHQDDIVFGGTVDGLYVEPTILSLQNDEGSIMQEEIFGPILPILAFKDENEVYDIIEERNKPLALYVFTEDRKKADALMNAVAFGGGMINHTILHLTNFNMPFGGIGPSGMGQYHGKYSIDAFSHKKSVMSASTTLNNRIMFPPFKKKRKLIDQILK